MYMYLVFFAKVATRTTLRGRAMKRDLVILHIINAIYQILYVHADLREHRHAMPHAKSFNFLHQIS